MTGDRLRQLAEGAEGDGLPWWTEADLVARGVHRFDAALMAALGPDAARLLADAMDRTDDPDLLSRFAALGEPS